MTENNKLIKLGNVYGNYDGMGFGGNVWSPEGLAPCLKTTAAATQQFVVVGVSEEHGNNKVI